MNDGKTSSSSVGYGRPPVGRRFRKGQSGNPAGRPKDSRNRPKSAARDLQALILEEAFRLTKMTVDDEEISMPVALSVIRALTAAAAKGDLRAQAAFLKMVIDSEDRVAAQARLSDGDTPGASEEVDFEIVIVDPKPHTQDQGGRPQLQTSSV